MLLTRVQGWDLYGPDWNLKPYPLFQLVKSGLEPFNESGLPIVPLCVIEAQQHLEIWTEWLRVKKGEVGDFWILPKYLEGTLGGQELTDYDRGYRPADKKLRGLMTIYHYHFDHSGWPIKDGSFLIQKIRGLAPTVEDGELIVEKSEFYQASLGDNPWASIPLDSNTDQQTEAKRLSDAFYDIAKLERFLALACDGGIHTGSVSLSGESESAPEQEAAVQEAAKTGNPQAASWEDFSFFLIADDTCRIKTPQGEKRYTFAELGMADGRKGNRATQLWKLIVIFASTGGCLTGKAKDTYANLRDTEPLDIPVLAKRLNKHLQSHFAIKDSIFQGPYKKNHEYRTKIKFYDHRDISPLK